MHVAQSCKIDKGKLIESKERLYAVFSQAFQFEVFMANLLNSWFLLFHY